LKLTGRFISLFDSIVERVVGQFHGPVPTCSCFWTEELINPRRGQPGNADYILMDFAAWLLLDARVENGKQEICELIDSVKMKSWN
jgi:hypothetical protein